MKPSSSMYNVATGAASGSRQQHKRSRHHHHHQGHPSSPSSSEGMTAINRPLPHHISGVTGSGVTGSSSSSSSMANMIQATPAVLFTAQQQQLHAMDEEESVEYRPISLNDTKRVSKYPGRPCFGCTVGLKPSKDPEDFEGAILWSVFKDNLHRLEPQALYQLISDTQKKLYVDPFAHHEEKPYPVWSPGQVEEHINDHLMYYDFEVTKDIRRLGTLVEFLEDNVGKEPSGGSGAGGGGVRTVQPNEKIIELLLKTIDKREAILCRYEKERMQQQG